MQILFLCVCVWFSPGLALLFKKSKAIFYLKLQQQDCRTVFSHLSYLQISYLIFLWLIQLFTWKWVVHCERESSSFQYKTAMIWVQWQNYPKETFAQFFAAQWESQRGSVWTPSEVLLPILLHSHSRQAEGTALDCSTSMQWENWGCQTTSLQNCLLICKTLMTFFFPTKLNRSVS